MNKTVIVTGGSRGIGKEISYRFLNNAYNVAIVSKSNTSLENISKEFKKNFSNFKTYQCDISNLLEIKSTITKIHNDFSSIDILINNAGISNITPIEEDNYDLWVNQIQINLISAYYFTREAFLKMRSNNWGRIINISSTYGLIGAESYSAYSSSKHGMNGLTKSLALELAKYNITVNAICPSWVDTDMFKQDVSEICNLYGISEQNFIESEINSIPLGKLITSQEIADLALFLVSDSAKNITGQLLNISGGTVI